jgi:hypothetical protein
VPGLNILEPDAGAYAQPWAELDVVHAAHEAVRYSNQYDVRKGEPTVSVTNRMSDKENIMYLMHPAARRLRHSTVNQLLLGILSPTFSTNRREFLSHPPLCFRHYHMALGLWKLSSTLTVKEPAQTEEGDTRASVIRGNKKTRGYRSSRGPSLIA